MYKASLLKLTKYYGNIIEKIKVATEIHNIHELKASALQGHRLSPISYLIMRSHLKSQQVLRYE